MLAPISRSRPMTLRHTGMESYHIRTLHRNSIAPLIESNVSTSDGLGESLRNIYVRKNYEEPAALPDDRWSLIP